MFKLNDEIDGELPKCGKGTDLTKGENPCWKRVSNKAEPEPVEPADKDPRSDSEIRDDIFTKYGDKIHPNMRRDNLLAKEKDLKRSKDMDAADTTIDYKVS